MDQEARLLQRYLRRYPPLFEVTLIHLKLFKESKKQLLIQWNVNLQIWSPLPLYIADLQVYGPLFDSETVSFKSRTILEPYVAK